MCKFDILLFVVAHYSSQNIYYEGGAKNPFNSTPVKLLVLASFAQIGVSAGNEDVGHP